jgi:ABC-type phosphate transport system substrate-binding protein
MLRVHFRRLRWLIFVLALAPIASSQNAAPVQLIGVGTTFPLPLYSIWWQAFQTQHPGTWFEELRNRAQQIPTSPLPA